MARPPSALTTFIRSLPVALPVKEVIEQAKAAGHETSESNVSRVRGMMAKTKTATKKTVAKKATSPKKSAPKKVAPKPTAPGTAKSAGVSKSEFIRLHPNLTTAEVIAAGKDQGLTFTSSLVYAVRGANAGKAATKKTASKKLAASTPAITSSVVQPLVATKPPVTSKPTAVPTGAAAGDARIEDLLRAAASALGFGRAMEVIREEQMRLRAMLGA